MAAQHQPRPTSSASTSASRPLSTHPQLRLPLSHHGLPRAPTSPKSSFSSRSHRYEPLSKDHRRHHSTSTTTPIRTTTIDTHRHSYSPDADDEEEYSSDDAYFSTPSPSSPTTPGARTTSHFFRLSTTAPPSPPMTPFSPSAFPSSPSAHDDIDAFAHQHCPRCRCSLDQARPAAPLLNTALASDHDRAVQRARARSMDEVPSPVRRQASTWSVGGSGRGKKAVDGEEQGKVQSTPPSSLAKFGKKIKAKLASGGGGEEGRRASRRVEYEELEEVHWTEI